MKKKVLIMSLLLSCIIGMANTQIPIELSGDLIAKKPRSTTDYQPLEVFLIGNDLKVNFFDCLGNLKIVVADENGMSVYQQTVNTCVTQSVTIDIQNLPAGRYCIIITDEHGGRIEGWFEI